MICLNHDSINQVMEDCSTQRLRANISEILFGVAPNWLDDASCNGFADQMVRDRDMFLLNILMNHGSVIDDGHIVSEKLGWFGDTHTQRSEHEADGHGLLCRCTHGHEFGAICTRCNASLALRGPLYQCGTNKNQDSRDRSPRLLVVGVVRIKEDGSFQFWAESLWLLRIAIFTRVRVFIQEVGIKCCPWIFWVEQRFIDLNWGRVDNQLFVR